jgi:ssDNA-binding Zn-finger/Zn-ribbon topoisomerase 1
MQCKVFSAHEIAPVVNGEEIKCQKCGHTLNIIHWNNGKDILTCNNGKCLVYRNPVSYCSGGHPLKKKTSIKSNEEDDQYANGLYSMFNDIVK